LITSKYIQREAKASALFFYWLAEDLQMPSLEVRQKQSRYVKPATWDLEKGNCNQLHLVEARIEESKIAANTRSSSLSLDPASSSLSISSTLSNASLKYLALIP
jgi:hypothetical protein